MIFNQIAKQKDDEKLYYNGQNKREFFSIFLLIELFLKHVSIVYQTKQQTLFFTNPKTE